MRESTALNTSSIRLQDFILEGNCGDTDPEAFFPDTKASQTTVRLCGACTVRAACLVWALEQRADPGGIWGGKTERERRKMKKDPVAMADARRALEN